jgi:hypothetical protein
MKSTNAAIVKEKINEFSRSFGAVRFIHEGRHFITKAHNLAMASILSL